RPAAPTSGMFGTPTPTQLKQERRGKTKKQCRGDGKGGAQMNDGESTTNEPTVRATEATHKTPNTTDAATRTEAASAENQMRRREGNKCRVIPGEGLQPSARAA